MSPRWVTGEAAQADYEQLRQMTLEGADPSSLTAARFFRRGLAGLIAWPSAEPSFVARMVGAERPPWTPGADPRRLALAEAYSLLARFGSDGGLEAVCWGEERA